MTFTRECLRDTKDIIKSELVYKVHRLIFNELNVPFRMIDMTKVILTEPAQQLVRESYPSHGNDVTLHQRPRRNPTTVGFMEHVSISSTKLPLNSVS